MTSTQKRTTAQSIVEEVGGAGNIVGVTHCATRLRFQLVDGSKVDTKAVEAIPGVMGGVPQGGDRYQIVIGGAVQTVYNDIMALPEMGKGGAKPKSDEEIKAAARASGVRGKVAWLDSFFEFLSDSFRPLIGALLGASLFITFMSLMSTLGVIGNWADPRTTLPPSWQFVNLVWQSVFVFLPLMVAYNASKKLGADPWVGFAIMAVVMLPGFTALGKAASETVIFGSKVQIVEIFGLPLTIFNYSSQVFPPLLMAAVFGPLTKLLKRIIPENVQLIFVPFFSLLIMVPLTAFLIGPIGVYAGAGIAGVLKSINDFSPLIFAIVIPLAYPFMVPLGLHWPINAIMLLNIQTLGYDFIQGPMGAWNFACFGATAGVLYLSIRDRDVTMRQTATGALAAGLLGGISEPSLYGIHLRYKRIYPRMLVGCLAGGLIIGIGGGLKTSAFVFTSLLTIPAFSNIPLYMIGIGSAFLIAMVLVIISDYRTPEQKAEVRREAELIAPTAVTDTIVAPVAGQVVSLDDVNDKVFSSRVMGEGVGIVPSSGSVVAPVSGELVTVADTGHAFGIKTHDDVEVLVHVGIDTVRLAGEHFMVKVSAGDLVVAGDLLAEVDFDGVSAAGYDTTTIVAVTNTDNFAGVLPKVGVMAAAGDPIIEISH